MVDLSFSWLQGRGNGTRVLIKSGWEAARKEKEHGNQNSRRESV